MRNSILFLLFLQAFITLSLSTRETHGNSVLFPLAHEIDERITLLENKISSLSSRVLSLEYSFNHLVQESPPGQQQQGHNPGSNVKITVVANNPPQQQNVVPVAVPGHVTPVELGDFRPKDCSEIMEELDPKQRHSTFYTIYPISRNRPLEVFCDMDTYGGGWTILQRRGFQGLEREDFNRTWKEYVKGFGHLNADYWLGLDNMAALTKYDDQEVLYEFLQTPTDAKRTVTYLNYDKFQVENGANLYRLHLAGFNEKFSTGLKYYLEKQDGAPFSTRDKDNAGTNNRDCRHHSGWWMLSTICHRQPDLNMPYDTNGVLNLHKFSIIQDRVGVSIKIRAKRNIVIE